MNLREISPSGLPSGNDSQRSADKEKRKSGKKVEERATYNCHIFMDRKKLYQACVLILNQHKKFAMAMFNSKLFVYQRVIMGKSWDQNLKMEHFLGFL